MTISTVFAKWRRLIGINQKCQPDQNLQFMNKKDFLGLPIHLQLAEIVRNGCFLDFILKGPYEFKLYQFHNYYVETCHHISNNRIESIIAFKNTKNLTPYLKKINIAIPPTPISFN